MATSKTVFDGLNMKSLEELGSSSNKGSPVIQGRDSLSKSRLRLRLTWDVSHLETKVLGVQDTDGPKIVISK